MCVCVCFFFFVCVCVCVRYLQGSLGFSGVPPGFGCIRVQGFMLRGGGAYPKPLAP